MTWNGCLIDWHNRYNVCSKHGIEFTTIEQEFPSRSAAIIWITGNQLDRRNINEQTRAFLIGVRHNEENKGRGGDRKSKPHSEVLKSSAHMIAAQSNVSHATVDRAAKE